MDLQTLSNLFAATLSSEPNARMTAELQIRKVGNEPGMIAALLQIIATDDVDIDTRHACSVWLKNRVTANYTVQPATRRPHQIVIASSDRDALRESILPLLAACPSRSITRQLASTLKAVIAYDFPERWPGLIDAIKQLLTSNNITHVHAGCIAALEAVRAFRFRENGELLANIVAALFPTLVGIAGQMMQTPASTAQEEVPAMLHLIVKTYRTSIAVRLSPHQQSTWQSLVPWGQLLLGIVKLEIPADVVPGDEEERERSEWWKVKKWAYRVLGWLFRRFGNPSQLSEEMKEDYNAFAQCFISMFAPDIIAMYLRQVELYIAGAAWLSKNCQYQIFTFFAECVKPKSTWLLLKPHAQKLVESFVFPQFSFTPPKQTLWESDPVDYARVAADEYELFPMAVSARSFLISLVNYRTRWTFGPIVNFVTSVLGSSAPGPQRFAALRMTHVLGPWLVLHPDFGPAKTEELILRFVVPEFANEEGWMRAAAFEVLGMATREKLEWSLNEHLTANLRAVLSALDDPAFPVRVQAVVALTEMIAHYELVQEAMKPHVGKVVQDLLNMSEDLDIEIFDHSMRVIVDHFHAELIPVTAQLTASLCDTYMRLASGEGEKDGGDANGGYNDKTYAATQITSMLLMIISSIHDHAPDILAEVQEIVLPVIEFTLKNKILILFDNMCDLVHRLTSEMHAISPNLWPVFEMICNLYTSDEMDLLDGALPALEDFLAYGADVIKARPLYQRMLLDISTTAIASDQRGELNRVNGCELAENILLKLHGSADDSLEPIVLTALSKLETVRPDIRSSILHVLIHALTYNPPKALRIIDTAGPDTAHRFFGIWVATIDYHNKSPGIFAKSLQVSMMAVTVLVEMEPGALPESVQDEWVGIMTDLLRAFVDPAAKKVHMVIEKDEEERDTPTGSNAHGEEEEYEEYEDDDEDWYSSDEDLDDAQDRMFNMKDDDEDVWDGYANILERYAYESTRLHDDSDPSKPKSRRHNHSLYVLNKNNWAR
ncbi:armadillo-type protein [Mycena polygramma]|nr:armadillo-type protein [Mycena polygramma]